MNTNTDNKLRNSRKRYIPSFQIRDVSVLRSGLMGLSILWIMMLHFRFTQIKVLGFIAQYGYAGVDIFLFVSGLGIYYSLDKKQTIAHYYLKRISRIFPTYYLIGVFASLFLFHDTLVTYLLRYTTLGFWINEPFFEWYIPSLIVLYIMAPFLKKLLIHIKQQQS